jgi:membrane protease YdiL (CAAX protease family)
MAPPIAWILTTIVGIVYVLYTIKAIPSIASMQREISLFKLLGILAAVIGGIVEEVFFRRWIMDMLMSRGFASIIQVIVSGVAFGLAHASWTLLAKRDFKVTLPAIMSTSILGFFLAIVYLAGGRNLGPCIFAHVMINVVMEPWLMLSAVSGKWHA